MSDEFSLSVIGAQAVADRFGGYDRLSVRQRKRWAEILLSFEMKNSYDVYDGVGSAVLKVQELGSGIASFFKRVFLGPLRPFSAAVTDVDSQETVLQLTRPFRFIFHRLEVSSGSGERMGAIQKRWSWIRKIYEIEGADGRVVATIFGPFLRPWTFEIQTESGTVGMIQKRWSGMGKELFTDADNFGVEMSNVSDPTLRALSFSATVLVDIVHFERAKGS